MRLASPAKSLTNTAGRSTRYVPRAALTRAKIASMRSSMDSKEWFATQCARAAAPSRSRSAASPESARQRRGQRLDVLLRHDERGLAVARDLGNRTGVGGDAGQPGHHRLHQRLRHAFVGVGGQREHVEGAEPGCDVAPVAGKAHARHELRLDRLLLQRVALRTVADDEQDGVVAAQARERVDQIAVPLPAAQRRDDADVQARFGQAEFAARGGAVARREDVGSMPVGTDVTRSAARPLSRMSCSRSISPVVTTCAAATP